VIHWKMPKQIIAVLGFGFAAVWSAVGIRAALTSLLAAGACYLAAALLERRRPTRLRHRHTTGPRAVEAGPPRPGRPATSPSRRHAGMTSSMRRQRVPAPSVAEDERRQPWPQRPADYGW
jgi:hypothetical protein